jgi:polar amino acid transport system substrate-binding protein
MRQMRLRLVGVAAALAIAVMAVGAGCGGDDDDNGGGGGGGTLTVGSDIPFPPFEQGNAPNYTGYDIDVINEVGKRIDRTIKIQDTAFDTIFTDLANGKFDAVISAATITADREKTVDFSDPYYEANQALVVPTGSDIKTTDDLGGKTVAAQDGTTGEDYANDETDAGSVNGFPTGPEAIQAVANGQADAGIIDEPVAKDALAKGQATGVEVAQTITTNELYGIAVAQDNKDLLDQINGALKEMKDDGTLQKFYDKWFPGVQVPDAVLHGTNQQLQ